MTIKLTTQEMTCKSPIKGTIFTRTWLDINVYADGYYAGRVIQTKPRVWTAVFGMPKKDDKTFDTKRKAVNWVFKQMITRNHRFAA